MAMVPGCKGDDMQMNLNTYYRGLAAERLQELGDRLFELSREAEQADAHDAAWQLADLSTQLLDMGLSISGSRTPRNDEPV